MITPHQLDLWSSNLAHIYNSLEGELIKQMIKRLKKGKTDVLEWQVEALKDLHLYNDDVVKLLSDVSGVTKKEIERMIELAGNQLIEDVDKELPFESKPKPNNLNKVIEGYSNQAWYDINNLVNQSLITTNYGTGTATQAYMDVLNRVSTLHSTGMLTIDKAIEKAINELAAKGIKSGFVDKGGNHWTLERYVRNVLKSTLGNTYNEIKTSRMAEYGVHTVIVTSHAGARPACAKIQGHVVDLRQVSELPENAKYKSIYDSYWKANYGTPDGHRGCNCAHQHIPFIPGVNTNNQLTYNNELNEKVYKLRQKQRYHERKIVAAKKQHMIAEQFGNEEQIMRSSQIISGHQAKLRNLVKNYEYISRDYKREKVYTPLETLLREYKE